MPISKLNQSFDSNAKLSGSQEIQRRNPLSSQHLISIQANISESVKSQELIFSGVSSLSAHELACLKSQSSKITSSEIEIFLQAIYLQDFAKAKQMIVEGMDVNVVCKKTNNTALLLAAQKGNIGFITYLLEKGADPNIGFNLPQVIKIGRLDILKLIHLKSRIPLDLEEKTKASGYTPLMLASRYGHKEIVEYLLFRGVSVETRCKKNCTALHYAAMRGQLEVIECLIAFMDINSPGYDHRTPLMEAIIEGQTSVVQFLLSQKGIDLNYASGEYGMTALMYAIEYNRLKELKLLIENRVDLHCCLRDLDRSTPLLWATMMIHENNIDEEIIKCLLDQYTLRGVDVRAFFEIAYLGNISLLDAFLSKGLDVNIQSERGHFALLLASQENKLEAVQYLISKGAYPDLAQKKSGDTSLMLASAKGHRDIVEYLLSQGASLSKTSESGRTAFHMACVQGQIEIVEFLIPLMDDLNSLDYRGRTPLIESLMKGHLSLFKLLLSQDKVDVHRSMGFRNPLMYCVTLGATEELKLLLEKDVEDINAQDSKGRTALLLATEKGDFECIQCLLSKGAHPNIGNEWGHTPLTAVCRQKYISWEMRKKIIMELCRFGADLNLRALTRTPLIEAFYSPDSMKVLSLMLDLGADINLRAYQGAKVLSCAICDGSINAIPELLKRGSEVGELEKNLAADKSEILELLGISTGESLLLENV